MITKYRLKKLIDPKSIDLKVEGKLIATPHAPRHTHMVTFNGAYQIIPKNAKPLAVRTFNDMFGRDKKYRLYYYLWEPRTPKEEVSVTNALASSMTQDRLQEMRKSLPFLNK